MNILIVGAGVTNKGAEAMIRTVQSELNSRLENLTFIIENSELDQGTENQIHALGISLVKRKMPKKINRLLELLLPILFFPRLTLQIINRRSHFFGWKKFLKDIDYVIDISGYRYGENWGIKYVISAFPIAFYSWLTRKPYYFLPQAWGPFDKQTEVFKICQWMCKKSTILFARDIRSQANLAKLLGEDQGTVALAPDIAFLFSQTDSHRDQIECLISQHNISDNLIGLAPNMRIYERVTGDGIENIYVSKLISLCNYFLNEGKGIVLIPHEINPQSNAKKDDRFLAKLIYENVDNKSKIIFFENVVSSDYLKCFLSKCELVVSSRYHAVVAALELCKPVVVIGWSYKYEELLGDVGLGEFVLDYDQDVSRLVEIVQKAENESDFIESKLERIIPVIKEKSSIVFDQVVSKIAK